MPELSIFDEIETAINLGSAEKSIETIRQVTNLFLASAGSFSAEQIELFDDVLLRLMTTIELRVIADVSARIVLAEISQQLASIAQAPPGVVRRLAGNNDISIARPVLTESARLSPDDLVEFAETKGERHLLAISERWWLKEVVTDALLARHYPSVSRRIAQNPGARFSAGGLALLVAQAASDPEIAVAAGIRTDLPSPLREQLLRKASHEVRARLLSRAPPHLVDEIRGAIAMVSAEIERELAKAYDFTAAKDLVLQLNRNGKLNEIALLGFAHGRKYQETVAALALLSQSTVEILRPLMQDARDDGLLAACKVAKLGWETVSAILACRYSTGSPSSQELASARERFAGLTADGAQKIFKNSPGRTPAGAKLH